jgi:hypothetical protein
VTVTVTASVVVMLAKDGVTTTAGEILFTVTLVDDPVALLYVDELELSGV